MKIWEGYVSEHSMNLVMIGQFKEVNDAKVMKTIIENLASQVEQEAQSSNQSAPAHRFSKEMLELLRNYRLPSLSPEDVDQLSYSFDVECDKTKLKITTEEIDVSVFLKMLIEKGARVEVFSRHDYPE